MSTIKIKKKVIVIRVEIDEPSPFQQIEIKLPANVKRVTGMLVTTSLKLWND